jgi:RNA polymerase sigma factor (sigma-70 family)
MEVSALKFSGGIGLHGRSPLLRLQSDERLVALVRRGSAPAFEALVSRYESRLLAFCRHLVGTREDAEDVLQEVFAAAYNAILADDRPINARPWLYRIARNRSLNHLRRSSAIGVDSMDIHLSDHGATTADKVSEREDFRLLVGDIHELPETQRTALVLREMDALSYEQIAEAMETTVSSVKSLLVRARVSLAEAAEARLLTCDEVRDELGEIAEGLRRRPTPAVRRHLKACQRCEAFRVQLKETNKALAAILPLGPLVVLKKLALSQFGHHAGSGAAAGTHAGGTAAGGAGVATGTAAGASIVAGSTAGSFLSAGIGAIATKAAAGLAAAALVTAGAVEVDRSSPVVHHHRHHAAAVLQASAATSAAASHASPTHVTTLPVPAPLPVVHRHKHHAAPNKVLIASVPAPKAQPVPTTPTVTAPTPTTPVATTPTTPTPPPGRTQTTSEPTVLPGEPTATNPPTGAGPADGTATTPTTTTPPVAPVPAPASTTAMPTAPPPTGTPTTGTTTTPTPPTGPVPTGPVPGGPVPGGPVPGGPVPGGPVPGGPVPGGPVPGGPAGGGPVVP